MLSWKTEKNLCRKLVFAAVFSLSILISQFSEGRELIDSNGQRVVLPQRPERIVTLIPSLGELVSDLLGENLNHLVAVSEYTDFPPLLKKKPSVGPYPHVNLEKILSLKPDLVLASVDGNSKEQIDHIRDLGLPVVSVKTGTFQEIQNSILIVADAVGVPSIGKKMVTQLRSGLDRLQEKALTRPKLRVLLELQDGPLITVGKNSFLNEAVELVGAQNIYSMMKEAYPRPSTEDVLQKNPDVILIMALEDNYRFFLDMAKRWKQFPKLNAVKNERVHVVKCDSLLRPTLRILDGLNCLSNVLYEKK
jgi:iron complex transport system substrate-binding protein